MEILDKISVDFNLNAMLGYLRLKEDSAKGGEFGELLRRAEEVASPKAIYTVSYIEDKGPDTVRFDGAEFTSKVLRVNLDTVERVFPYVVTCGAELDGIDTDGDMLRQYWLDEIKSKAMATAVQHLYGHIDKHRRPGKLSTMNPGSAAADVWPIEQQKPLFSIFGDVEALIGVRLTESFLMVPNKTISGIFFAAENNFESCQLCPRESCKGRRAPYDPESVKEYAERQ